MLLQEQKYIHCFRVQRWPCSLLCQREFYHRLQRKYIQASDFLTLEGNYFYFKTQE